MKNAIDRDIKELLKLIEKKLDWGDPAQWTGKDFEKIQDRIEEETGANVSVSTLKRIWGRVQSKNTATTTTLDILSKFAGFEDWRAFKQGRSSKPNNIKARSITSTSFPKGIFLLLSLLLLLAAYFYFQTKGLDKDKSETPEMDIQTLSEKSVLEIAPFSSGLPTSISLNYKIETFQEDAFSLVSEGSAQTMNVLNKRTGTSAFTYYHPGYYAVNLQYQGELVLSQAVAIATSGWTASLDSEKLYAPIYLDTSQLIQGEVISFSEEVFEQITQDQTYTNLWLEKVEANPKVSGKDFSFQSEVRMTRAAPINPCKTITYMLHGTKEKLAFGFVIPGCTGDLRFSLAGEEYTGAANDLSGFGQIQGEEWIALKVKGEKDLIRIEANGGLILEAQLNRDLGLMGGVSVIFSGIGEVRNTAFR